MSKLIIERAEIEKCALYNELSHMTPYYLAHKSPEQLNINKEAIFHINNLKLLSLYFDKVLIPIENILAFANNRNKLVVENVVSSKPFQQMVDLGIISFCGWGAETNKQMLTKGIAYSLKDFNHLKNHSYLRKVENISLNSSFYTRDSSRYDIGHNNFLLNKLKMLETHNYNKELKKISDFIIDFYSSYKYIGSLEYFRYIENEHVPIELSNSLYYSYYQAWQEYCYKQYSPAVTVNSERLNYIEGNIISSNNQSRRSVNAKLYSPAIFLRFLRWQLGDKVTNKLLSIDPKEINSIRNGDGAWYRFMTNYHQCLEASSSICWLQDQISLNNVNNQNSDDILDAIFSNKKLSLDLSLMIDFTQIAVTLTAWIAQTFNPVAIFVVILSRLFNFKASAPFRRDALDFYKKVNVLAQGSLATSSIL